MMEDAEMRLVTVASLEAPGQVKLAWQGWLLCHSASPGCCSSACLTACELKGCLWWLLSSYRLHSDRACNHKYRFHPWQDVDAAVL